MRRPNPLLDSKRPLDKEGKKHCLQLAHVLNALNIQFDLIVSSPLKRCLQTASLVGTETGYEAQILHSTALAPDATLKDFQKLLRDCSNRDSRSWALARPCQSTADLRSKKKSELRSVQSRCDALRRLGVRRESTL